MPKIKYIEDGGKERVFERGFLVKRINSIFNNNYGTNNEARKQEILNLFGLNEQIKPEQDQTKQKTYSAFIKQDTRTMYPLRIPNLGIKETEQEPIEKEEREYKGENEFDIEEGKHCFLVNRKQPQDFPFMLQKDGLMVVINKTESGLITMDLDHYNWFDRITDIYDKQFDLIKHALKIIDKLKE